ncbi:MAG: hypothetical protein PHV57_09365 [Methanomicrobiaceae archaeon]|nr:hypothetical protein [Methanomicrobiaceae archaeon]
MFSIVPFQWTEGSIFMGVGTGEGVSPSPKPLPLEDSRWEAVYVSELI